MLGLYLLMVPSALALILFVADEVADEIAQRRNQYSTGPANIAR